MYGVDPIFANLLKQSPLPNKASIRGWKKGGVLDKKNFLRKRIYGYSNRSFLTEKYVLFWCQLQSGQKLSKKLQQEGLRKQYLRSLDLDLHGIPFKITGFVPLGSLKSEITFTDQIPTKNDPSDILD